MDTFSKINNYHSLIETATDPIIVINSDGLIQLFNPAAVKLFGWTASEALGEPISIIIPENYREAHSKGFIDYIKTKEPKLLGKSFIRLPALHKDGTIINTNISLATWTEGNGDVFFTGVLRDATELVEHEETTELLIKELNHRVKNTLAIVNGVAMQTAKNAKTVLEYKSILESRISSMSQAHDLLVDRSWTHTTFHDLLDKYLKDKFLTYKTIGPDLCLKPSITISLGMGIYELKTNAIKYGGWRSLGGLIQISTEVVGKEIKIVWKEFKGSSNTTPGIEGFGTTLLKEVVPRSVRGKAFIEYTSDGLEYTIIAPLNNELSLA